MTAKELKRLSRSDLLEMLLELSRENEQLRQENLELRARLEEKTLKIENTGSLAEAALVLNGVFQAAQEACEQYSLNIRSQADTLLAQARAEAQQILEDARRGQTPENKNGDSQ